MKKYRLFIALIILYSCKKDKANPETPTNQTTNSITYTNTIKNIIEQKCNNCHGTQGSTTNYFPDYIGVKQKVDDGTFRETVIVQKSMPYIDTLSKAQFSSIETWLNNNAPE